MGIRLSGLSSGMDTEALVSALVSSYSMQKDNLVKAQTKLSWKQESWKAMNTSIYSFYSGKLSAARLSKTYNLKSATVSHSAYAKVTADSSAVNGTQTLEVKKLAATGYLTGGTVSGKDEQGKAAKVTGSSKLSSMIGTDASDGSISVTVDGNSKDIAISKDMSVNEFVVQLKNAGLEANFDEVNQRFFISSKTSGASHDFSMVANNEGGLKALQGMGLFTTTSKDGDSSVEDASVTEYRKWASYATDADGLAAAKEEAYKKVAISYESRAKEYASKYNAAKAVIDSMESNDTWVSREQLDNALSERKQVLDDLVNSGALAGTEKLDENGQPVMGKYGLEFDTAKMNEEQLKSYNAAMDGIKNVQSQIELYDKNVKIMEDTAQYVNLDQDGNAVAATKEDALPGAYNNVVAAVDADNAVLRQQSDAAVDSKVAYAVQMVQDIDSGKYADSAGAVRISGSDSEIILNGATFTNNTNNFSINGLTIQAQALTKDDEKVTITTDTDVDGIYNSIKEFLKEYNTLITAMDTAYNAASAKGYEPLTSEEKEAMTDDEVEKWEKKIKDSLLRKDATLGSASSAMKSLMITAIEVNGKKYSLASFGIKTLGYFDSGENEKGVFHIDGDKDDTKTAGNTDKLRAAIANDPDTVISFFSQLATNVYTDLTKRMSSTTMSSIYTIYNDKEMAAEYSEYNTKISDKEDEVTKWEDYYYKKFSRMESALASLNSQSSALSGFFGR